MSCRTTGGAVAAAMLATLALGACAAPPTTHHRPGTSHEVATGERAGQTAPVSLTVALAGGRPVEPPGWVDVDQGNTVGITVISDSAARVVVKGMDAVLSLADGGTGLLTVTPDRTGVFSVLTGDGALLLQLAVS